MRSQNARRSEDGEVIMCVCVREREHETCNNFWKVLCVFPDQKKKKEKIIIYRFIKCTALIKITYAYIL